MSQAPLLQDFVAEMQKGLARTNRFFVLLPGKETGKLMGMFCENVQLPSSTILTSPSRIFGEVREVPYERSYEPINMSFYVDSDFQVKKYFDDWHNSIFDQYNKSGKYYEEYAKQIEIWVHNVEDKRTYAVTLNECYPKSIGAIQLDYGSKEIMKVQVTMQFKNWRAVAGNAAASESALANINNPPVQAEGDTFAELDLNNLVQGLMDNGGLSGYLNDFQSFQNDLQSQVSGLQSFAKDPVGSYLGGNNFNISFG